MKKKSLINIRPERQSFCSRCNFFFFQQVHPSSAAGTYWNIWVETKIHIRFFFFLWRVLLLKIYSRDAALLIKTVDSR